MREEEKKRTSPKSNFFRKRWVFPAIYLLSAAIILTGVLWFQSSNSNVAEEDFKYEGSEGKDTALEQEPTVPVNTAAENFAMPVLDKDTVEIQREFYNVNGTDEEQQAALVFYDNTYYENKGIDIAAKDGKAFDVVSSLAGTVTKSEKDSLFGHIVEIEHAEGVVTVYQSLADVQVQQGDRVDQGQVIAKAGQNQFDEESAIHVHFEIRNNGTAVNPIEFFGKPLTSLEEETPSEEPAEGEKAPASEDEGSATSEEETPASEEEDEDTPADEEQPEGEEDEDSSKPEDASIGMARA